MLNEHHVDNLMQTSLVTISQSRKNLMSSSSLHVEFLWLTSAATTPHVLCADHDDGGLHTRCFCSQSMRLTQ